jgi:hypothetical protein
METNESAVFTLKQLMDMYETNTLPDEKVFKYSDDKGRAQFIHRDELKTEYEFYTVYGSLQFTDRFNGVKTR